MASTATIRAQDLTLLLAAVRIRRHTAGRTCLLAALSEHPLLECDCHFGHRPSPDRIQRSRQLGLSHCTVAPLNRGFIGLVFERTARQGGRREVMRTWGTGIRSLRAEPRYTLQGGKA